MTFSTFDLHPNIQNAIIYPNPTPVQEKSIPHILEGNDVVVTAQTGTGKTAAFVLPALHRLAKAAKQKSKKALILILTPTRELATQITKAANQYGKLCNFNIVNLVGGMPYHHQIKDLARGADIIVATPGRLLDHLQQRRVDLSQIEMLVLDEADRMLDMGFIDDVHEIADLTPEDRQTLLFSATINNQLMHTVRHLLKKPVRIDLSNEKIASPQIKQEVYRVSNVQQKSQFLRQYLRTNAVFKAIIFSATKVNADRLADQLQDEGFSAAALHGDLRQNVRNRTVDQLRKGKIQYLVATDVAARGIDIQDITHVINFDLPRFCEDYVHRIGRTGRAGKTGIAISFILPTDFKHLQRIEKYIGQKFKFSYLQDRTDEGEAGTGTQMTKKEMVSEDRFSREEFTKERRSSKKSAGYGDRPFKKEFSRERTGRDSTREDRPFKKEFSRERTSRDSTREDKPFKKEFSRERTSRDSTREDKPFKKEFSRERTSRDSTREDRPFKKEFSRERTSRDSTREDRPFKKEFSRERTSRDSTREDRPFKKEFSRERTSRDSTREDRPFKKEFSRERTSRDSTREDRPFKKEFSRERTSRDSTREDRPFKKEFSRERTSRDSTREDRPYKKEFTGEGRGRKSFGESRPFKKEPFKKKFTSKSTTTKKPTKRSFANDVPRKSSRKKLEDDLV